jgi:polysaccharide export outer membrane protein
MRRLFPAAAALLAIALASCAATGAPISQASGDPAFSTVKEYKLGAGDQLRVLVFGQSDLSGQFIVSVHGTLAFPLIGEVQVSGLTTNQARDELASRLSKGYVLHPGVSVEVTTYRPFYILGEVQSPGTYQFSPGLSVVKAIATAGGFGYRANSRLVFIQHDDQQQEQQVPLTTSTLIQPGDTVRVPERRF